jgi:hypothetical protein
MIDPRTAMIVQPELTSGESLYWAGMPNPKMIFHSDDWYTIPFSLMWGGFTIFWEAAALGYWGNTSKGGGHSTFMAIWGIPFVVMGQYMIWGRFLVDAWCKHRTYYAVTNRRVLIVQEAWHRKSKFIYLEAIPSIAREGTNIGTLWLGPKLPIIGGRGQPHRSPSRFDMGDGIPVLADIDDVNSVHRLIIDLREKARKETSDGSPILSYS